MIAALDVGSVNEKEVNKGAVVYADKDGREHFSHGRRTKNAQTTFDGSSDVVEKITAAIDGYLNQSPDKPSPPTPPLP